MIPQRHFFPPLSHHLRTPHASDARQRTAACKNVTPDQNEGGSEERFSVCEGFLDIQVVVKDRLNS